MQFVKKLIKQCIGIYLSPFTSNKKLYYYTKDIIFTNCVEHLHRAVAYIKNKGNINNSSCIIDIGAADGGTTLFFSMTFPGRKVYGYEPNTNEYAKAKSKATHLDNVIFRNKALGEEDKNSTLYVTQNKFSSSLNKLNESDVQLLTVEKQKLFQQVETQEVVVSTLDIEFVHEPAILLIKVDTQGTELSILKGAIKTLAKTKYILLEMNNHHLYNNTCQYYEVDEFLRKNGFKLVQIYAPWGDANEYDALYANTII